MEPSKIRQLFSQRVDDQLDGSAARAFDQALEQDADLAQDYASFAGVLELVRSLPQPEPDPDFVSKVSRRIKRRQRGRRRGRREQQPLPLLGTLSTLFALVLVAGIGFVTHSVGGEISAIEAAKANPPIAPGVRLVAAFDAQATEAAGLFSQAIAQGLIQRVTQTAPGNRFSVAVDADKLPIFLDWLGQRHTLRIGERAGSSASAGVVIELQVVSPPAP